MIDQLFAVCSLSDIAMVGIMDLIVLGKHV